MAAKTNTTSMDGTSQRASIACRTCRLRKVKCDAHSVPPGQSCSSCRRSGQECFLDPSSDGRRSVSRKYVDELQQRIQILEALNKQTTDPADPTDLDASDSCSKSPVNLTPSPRNQRATITPKPFNPPRFRSNGSSERISSTASLGLNQGQPTSTLQSADASERLPDDLPGFYGVTSHPHVSSPPDQCQQPCAEEVVELAIDLDANSSHLRDHLLQSYFKYQTLWVDIVNRECFSASRTHRTQSRWYCDFLENSMLACATRLSTSKAMRALGPEYIKLAKSDALRAMSEPTPANLQGFLLLSEYEVTQGNDRPGWMYCGVACRMLSDLGLHELADITGASGRAQGESSRESDLAYALLSACIVYEGVWTLYLGRPSSIPKSIMTVAATRCKAQRSSDSLLLNAWLGLCVPMAEISHILNDEFISESDASVSLPKSITQMQDWYDQLPEELVYSESRLANLNMAGYGLHTQYCKVQILLRQALARCSNRRKRKYSQVSSDELAEMSPDEADRAIYQYSVRIARLVVTYREVFGVEKIPSIMLDNAVVAASAMLEHINKTGSTSNVQHDTIWIQALVKSMEAVQPHFPIIRRMLNTLRQMSCGRTLFGIMPSTSPELTGGIPSKSPTSGISQDPKFQVNLLQQGSNGVEIESNDIFAPFNMTMNPGAFFWGVDDIFPGLISTSALVSDIPQAGLY